MHSSSLGSGDLLGIWLLFFVWLILPVMVVAVPPHMALLYLRCELKRAKLATLSMSRRLTCLLDSANGRNSFLMIISCTADLQVYVSSRTVKRQYCEIVCLIVLLSFFSDQLKFSFRTRLFSVENCFQPLYYFFLM